MSEPWELGVTVSAYPIFRSPSTNYYQATMAQPGCSITLTNDALALSGDTAGWVIEAAKKLETLGRFRAGWDSYRGQPLSKGARCLMLQVLAWLRKEDLPVPGVVLGSGGDVQIEWRANGKELEIDLRDNNTIEYVMVSSDGEIEEGESSHGLPEKVRSLAGWLVYA
jgi:hypothetical protein